MDAQLESISSSTVRERVEAALQPGEAVVVYAEGLLRVISPLFDKCSVMLTDGRLILLAPGWPWGLKVRGAESRKNCTLLKRKTKFDGSQLVILRQGEEIRCLYFSRTWRRRVDLIRAELADKRESHEEFATNVEALRELSALGEMPSSPDPGE